MKEVIDVNTGEVAVRRGEFILRAIAIGSCIVVAAYDSKVKVAGMVHIMLPGHAPEQSSEKTRYADDGIEQMLSKMFEFGSDTNGIEVCLIGAGNVLQKEDDTICADNIKSVTTILGERSISVRALVLGGYKRKSAFLDGETGNISYTEGNDREKRLWQPPDAVSAEQSLKGG